MQSTSHIPLLPIYVPAAVTLSFFLPHSQPNPAPSSPFLISLIIKCHSPLQPPPVHRLHFLRHLSSSSTVAPPPPSVAAAFRHSQSTRIRCCDCDCPGCSYSDDRVDPLEVDHQLLPALVAEHCYYYYSHCRYCRCRCCCCC